VQRTHRRPPALGGLALSANLGVALAVILARGGRHELTILARDLCLLLSVPAIASGLSLVILFAIASARRAI
jgi:ABC-type spermidine/putrescine transport system permease subunit II